MLMKIIIALFEILAFVFCCAIACVIALFSFIGAVEFLEAAIDEARVHLAKGPC